MSLENMISSLKKMRFLAHEDDSIEVLEEILNEISQTADNTVIGDLCSVFHDEIDEPSIIGDLIETIFYIIERNGIEEGLYELIEGMSYILPQARYCAKRLYRSLLATDDLIVPFINVLRKVTPSQKAEVINILKEISDKQPKQYLEKVNFIFKGVI
ncbi:hypothetical protein [Bacillus sp. LK2]|uniref:hypothetical protein n=1 Tax=Bacillus sp. LK2 TaxID=1628206 RepID=UPI000652F2C4|nr:hypothetical protein [Bacillus sp. LK2]KMN45599.1 hypothetical protein VK90_07790 [Bacillus sp. LK2]